MAVVRSASITRSQASTSAAGATPTVTIRSPSVMIVSPLTKGSFRSPETIVPMLTIATRMVPPALSRRRRPFVFRGLLSTLAYHYPSTARPLHSPRRQPDAGGADAHPDDLHAAQAFAEQDECLERGERRHQVDQGGDA